MRGHTALTAQSSCQPGSRGSSWGSSKKEICYPQKGLRRKGLTALGSRGSSSFNFLAVFERKRVREEKEKKKKKYIRVCKWSWIYCYLCYPIA